MPDAPGTMVASGSDMGNVLGAAALGTGIFRSIGPQKPGILRDWTGVFEARLALRDCCAVL